MRKRIMVSFIVVILLSFIGNTNSFAEEFNHSKVYESNPQLMESIINKIKVAIDNFDENVDITYEYGRYYLNLSKSEFYDVILSNLKYATETYDYYGFVVQYGVTYETNSKKATINLGYQSNAEDLRQKKCEIDNIVKQFKENYIKEYYTDFQKEMAVVDYIDDICEYDRSISLPYIHSAYGALVNRKAVCDGYARAANILFKACNLESYFVTSYEISHAWNKVKIDNKYYNVDLTFTDGCFDYRNINLTDEKFSELNKCNDFLNNNTIPKCTDLDFDYFNQNVSRILLNNYPINYIYCRDLNKVFFIKNNKMLSSNIYGKNIKEITENVSTIICTYNDNIIFTDLSNNINMYNLLLNTKKSIYCIDNSSFIVSFSLNNDMLDLKTYNISNESMEEKFINLKFNVNNNENTKDNLFNDVAVNENDINKTDKPNKNNEINKSDNIIKDNDSIEKKDEIQKEDKQNVTDTINNNKQQDATATIDGKSDIEGDDNNIIIIFALFFIGIIFTYKLYNKKIN